MIKKVTRSVHIKKKQQTQTASFRDLVITANKESESSTIDEGVSQLRKKYFDPSNAFSNLLKIVLLDLSAIIFRKVQDVQYYSRPSKQKQGL